VTDPCLNAVFYDQTFPRGQDKNRSKKLPYFTARVCFFEVFFENRRKKKSEEFLKNVNEPGGIRRLGKDGFFAHQTASVFIGQAAIAVNDTQDHVPLEAFSKQKLIVRVVIGAWL
jgi:hypothetical protein